VRDEGEPDRERLLLGAGDARRVRELAAAEALPAVAVGRDWLFEPAVVARFKATPRRGRGRPPKDDVRKADR